MWRKSSLFFVCALLTAGQRFEATEPHMGTLFRITIYASDADRAHDAFAAAFERVKELDNALSDYKPDSELMRVCRTAYGQPVRVSPDLYTVLDESQRLARATSGAFDVTLGPVIRLWRKARIDKRVPSREALQIALEHCGYRKMVLDQGTVKLTSPDMLLDLGAIAKGYAADQALEALRQNGITRALVAASGDIAASGPPPGKAGWRIGIDCPVAALVLTLANAAVSTSGDTEQYLEIDGVRYSHIIDPMTAQGLTQRFCVSVVADRGIHADSLATALSVLSAQRGPRSALEFIEGRAAARIVYQSPAGWVSAGNLFRPLQ